MTIRRQYSLPNCTLVLEGFSTSQATSRERPPLEVLVRFECRLATKQPLVGGRNLLEDLAAAVSQFAQEFLSGVRRAGHALNDRATSVRLQPLSANLSRLSVPSELLFDGAKTTPDAAPQAPPIEIDLSTVQVFDLVEALDQFFADTQTLPDLSPRFEPLSRRASTGRQPAAGAAPVALGVTSLALASVALFLVPIPKVEEPRPPTPQRTTPQTGPNQPQPAPVPRQSRSGAALAATQPTRHQQLNQNLYAQIAQAQKTQPSRTSIYHVGVDQTGKITGYRSVNRAAVAYTPQTPLFELLDVPLPGHDAPQPSAQFKVVFMPSGALQVTPWASR